MILQINSDHYTEHYTLAVALEQDTTNKAVIDNAIITISNEV